MTALTPSMRAELAELRAQEPALLKEALEYQDWHDAAYSEWIQSIRAGNANAGKWTAADYKAAKAAMRDPQLAPQLLADCQQGIAYLTEPEYAENRADDIARELQEQEAAAQ